MPSDSPLPRLELLKVGSDPEALFVKIPSGELVSAISFVGAQKYMSSWIGADGNSATAELRPRPARDVWLHARDIAAALDVVNQVVCLKKQNVCLIAQPYHEPSGSACGGHIHASFVLHDPVAVPAIARGAVWNVAGSGTRSAQTDFRPGPETPAVSHTYQSVYRTAVLAGSAFGFNHLVRKLRVFVAPLETGLHPTDRRAFRRYGDNEDALRSEHPATMVKPGVLRWRVEYRYPSTWLAHPALALVYLGLVKLVVNNYHLLAHEEPPQLSALPVLLDAFLRRPGAVVTDDVRHLPKILRFVLMEVQPRLQQPLVPVDFDAWARFLNEGRWK